MKKIRVAWDDLKPGDLIHQFPGGDAQYFNAGRNHPLLSF